MIQSRKSGSNINAKTSIKSDLVALRDKYRAELDALTGVVAGTPALAYA
jgi:hypothetical protein